MTSIITCISIVVAFFLAAKLRRDIIAWTILAILLGPIAVVFLVIIGEGS